MKPKDTNGLAFPKPGIRKPRSVKPDADQGPESLLQSRCEQYCDLRGVEWFHIPQQTLNAAFGWKILNGPQLWAARKASEAISGYPDLTLFYRKMFYKSVELKSSTGIVSKDQEDWRKRLGGEVVYKFDTFRGLVDAWIVECDRILEHGKAT
jgi:hypothetical protein